MKIVYMGTPEFALLPLNALISRHDVVAVITQPDKPAGRGKKLQFPPVKKLALENNISVFQPIKVKSPQFIEDLRQISADIFIVAAFGQLLPEEILNMPKYGSINIHASLLPKYRGAAPIQWAIINGESETGITIMQMEKGLDTGDILYEKTVSIDQAETGETLHNKLAAAGADAILEALEMIEAETITAKKQNSDLSTYAPMLKKETGKINWNDPAIKIQRLVRGLFPWPCAYSHLEGFGNIKIIATSVSEQEASAPAGTIEAIDKKRGFIVSTGEKCLLVEKIQLSGKKAVTVHDFLLGNKVKEGLAFN